MTASATKWETIHGPQEIITLHRHDCAYLTVVLDGTYEEKSADGRFELCAGDFVIHPANHKHANFFGSRGARTLNFDVRHEVFPCAYGAIHGAAAYELQRLARRNPLEAMKAACEETGRKPPLKAPDWLETLAAHLRDADNRRRIADLAHAAGVSPEHTARSFVKHYGVGPSAYRQEMRMRRALDQLRRGCAPARVAQMAGYADQSHLTRTLRQVIGLTPRELHRQIKSVQDGDGGVTKLPV